MFFDHVCFLKQFGFGQRPLRPDHVSGGISTGTSFGASIRVLRFTLRLIIVSGLFLSNGIVPGASPHSAMVWARDYHQQISTYYVSPFGSFNKVFLKPHEEALTGTCDAGTIYFGPDGRFKACQNDVSTGTTAWSNIAIWEKKNDKVYLADTALYPDMAIGIGTSAPEFKLTLDTDGGIIAEGTLDAGTEVPVSGAGTRLIWHPRKAAFRAGRVTADQWDEDNIAKYSFAVGLNTRAPRDPVIQGEGQFAAGRLSEAVGKYAVAMGNETYADGFASVAMGSETLARGRNAAAFGFQTQATGDQSVAFGRATLAEGHQSIAMGHLNRARGHQSFASGEGNLAQGNRSFAACRNTKALGNNSFACGRRTEVRGNESFGVGFAVETNNDFSQAFGNQSHANGISSFAAVHGLAGGDYTLALGNFATANGTHAVALGRSVTADAYTSLVVGAYNVPLGTENLSSWVNTDPIFVIGNGQRDIDDPSNAVVVLKNGDVGIGTDAPSASLTVVGIPEHADNAAAVAAGLTAGAFYRTGDNLKVVH